MDKILDKYSIVYKKIDNPQKGYRNNSYIITLKDNTRINLIIYKREKDILKRILNANKVSSILRDKIRSDNFEIRYPINKILKLKDNYYSCIYNYIEGSTIPWDGYSKKHLKLLGEYLNKIHYLTSSEIIYSKITTLELESSNLKKIIYKVLEYFNNDNVANALNNKLGLNINFIQFLNNSLKINNVIENTYPKTILHMDFVRGNILFNNPELDSSDLKITGILDFEKCSIGSPIFDISRTLAFLIVDCKYSSELEIRKYFLKSGYIKRGKYKLKCFEYLNILTTTYLIYDFYKFLKHNPYEFLNSNEHFIRTRDILLRQRLLKL